MDDVHALERLRVGEPADHVALGGGLGIAGRGHHDGDGRTRLPGGRGDRGERAGGRAHQQRGERGVQQRHERLGLGVSEAGVELDHAHAARGERQTGVEQPGERGAAAGHLVDGGLQHVAQHLLDQALGRPRQRGVGAHAAGVGALVAVEDALEVLGGLQGVDGRPVGLVPAAQGEERHLRPVEELLDDHALALRGVLDGGVAVGGDDHALAGGQAVVLDDVGRAVGVEGGLHLDRGRAHHRRGGRDAGGLHDLLGERLGALELRSGARRTEDRDPPPTHHVGDPGHQRRLGAHDDQVRTQRLGEVGDRLPRERVDVVQRGDRRDAGVARRRVHRAHAGVERERAGQRVLAPPGADDETGQGGRAHARVLLSRGEGQISGWTTTVASREGPTPTAEIRAPDIFSTART